MSGNKRMFEYRIYYGEMPHQSTTFDAPTSEDALTMAKLNFERFGFKTIKIELVKELNND